MIGNNFEQSIIGLFNNNINSLYTINQIAKKLKKDYPYINKKVNYFIKEGVLNKLTLGKSYLCSINLENEKSIVLLSINEINKKESFLEKNPESKILFEEIAKLSEHFDINFSLFHSNSFIIVTKESGKQIAKTLLFSKKTNTIILSKEEFLAKMPYNEDFAKHSIIVKGCENYFAALKKIQKIAVTG